MQRTRHHRWTIPAGSHILWLSSLSFLFLVCVLTLVSCGSAAPAPQDYVWSDTDTFVLLTWHEQNGSLSGMWTAVSYAATPFPASTSPQVTGAGYAGTLAGDGSLTITFDGTWPRITLAGREGNEGQTLILTASNPATGQPEQQTWVAVTKQQESALLAAFNPYEVVRGMLAVVQQETAHEQAWSDPNANDVTQARQAVIAQASELATIQQARDETARCHDIVQFEPLPASTFTLLFAPSENGLVRDVTTLVHAWAKAERAALPPIAGLYVAHLPWVISAQIYQRGIQPASVLAAHIQTVYQQDERTMQQLKTQDQAIAAQVTALGAHCPPMPA